MSDFPSFSAFHRGVTGHDPFPWQDRLASHVGAHGWPGRIAVPTGLGKTTTTLVALYELARQVHAGAARTQQLRIVHVVDRRSIVDQTELTYRDVNAAFDSSTGAAGEVGRVLRDRYGKALVHTRLHAGAKDSDWVHPDRPTLMSMTSHQFVSRLLFRGFGVSAGMSPIHAGLLGVDCLVLFDEPHLSVPAITTILSAQKMQQAAPSNEVLGVPAAGLTVLGATVPPVHLDLAEGTIGVDDADRNHPVAGRRLNASRELTVQQLPVASDTSYVTAMVKTALAYRQDGAEHVGVMVNDVALARQVHDGLQAKSGTKGAGGFDTMLVTSRMRPIDRSVVDSRLATDDLPAFTVATQTLEAGVDVSFDALITEAAPLPSIIQRLGRLNRRGDLPQAGATLFYSMGTGEGGQDMAKPRAATKAIYGQEPVEATVTLLLEAIGPAGTISFSPTDVERITREHRELTAASWPAQRAAATLHSGWAQVFTQTRPRPSVDIPVEAFISGRIPQDQGTPEVRVAWREDTSVEALEAMPPLAPEILSIPLPALKAFLQNGKPFHVADTDDASLRGATTPASTGATLHRCARLGDEGWERVEQVRDLTPGLVVLHTSVGGYDRHGWNPVSHAPVQDHGMAQYLVEGHWGLITEQTPGIPDGWWETLAQLAEDGEDGEDLQQALGHLEGGLAGFRAEQLELGSSPAERAITVRLSRAAASEDAGPPDPVGLEDHSRQVGAFARRSAERIGAAPAVVDAVEWAGYLHDVGKERPEWQRMLGATEQTGPLAKTLEDDPDPVSRRRRARLSGLEPGWRHEAASTLTATERGASNEVVHLVATHHGWARPLMVPCGQEHVQAGDATRFRALNEQYGPWGLAWMEAIVRLADHEASGDPHPGSGPPVAGMPLALERTSGGGPIEVRMPGLRVESPAEWWAAFGMLAAARELLGDARIRFQSRVPILDLPTVENQPEDQVLEAISGHLLATVRSWATGHGKTSANPFPGVFKNQKWNGEDTSVYHRGDALATLMQSTYTDVHDAVGQGLESIGPWWPNNGSRWGDVFDRSSRTSAELIRQVALSVEPAQFTNANCGGLNSTWEARLKESGVGHRSRADLLLMVAYGIGTNGFGNGDVFLGTVRSGRTKHALLPLPTRPSSIDHLIGLTQTVPRTRDRDWASLGVPEALTATVRYQNDGKKNLWEHERITILTVGRPDAPRRRTA